jgi:hypothetical protein
VLPPGTPFTSHTTDTFEVPEILAENCCWELSLIAADDGVTVTETETALDELPPPQPHSSTMTHVVRLVALHFGNRALDMDLARTPKVLFWPGFSFFTFPPAIIVLSPQNRTAQALKVRVSPSTIGLDSVRENTAIYSSKVIYRTAVGLVLKNAAASRNAVGPEWLTSMRLAHCPIHHRYQH